jgi:hypothetical protein
MITLRRSNERGKTKLNSLDRRHTFSFGDYYDPQHMVFRELRVVNEDRGVPLMTLGILTGGLWVGIHCGNYCRNEPSEENARWTLSTSYLFPVYS